MSFTLKPKDGTSHLAAVDADVAVRDQLTRGRARIGEAQVITNVIQPGLQNLQHLFAGDTTAA